MKYKTYVRYLLLASLFIATSVAAESMVVIVNSSNTQTVSKEDVKNIYADRIIEWSNGNKMVVYNLPMSSGNREVFSQLVLGVSAKTAASDESNRAITNTMRNPQKMKRERLVASIVSKNPNAIGYVSEKIAKTKSGIRVLFSIK